MIPVSVLIATKNEAGKIAACIDALQEFGEIIVIDSASRDKTVEIVRDKALPVVEFSWNGHYPKKRQWILDSVQTRYDWVFFVDADEIMTPELKNEIADIFANEPQAAGFYIKGLYKAGNKILKHGLSNLKLCLFDKTKLEFPIVDDLDIPGMGEMEGHYQPVLKAGYEGLKIGRLESFLIHDAYDDERAWIFRHQKYARWEAGMNMKKAWPSESASFRGRVKSLLRQSRFRPQIVFLTSFILFKGFLDGNEGFEFAERKARYYKLISQLEN